MQGFKSFPEKTRLTFEKDITAIVGPNGSGKSNISDALLWVMGEQRSKALRGGKMEDVIFGGTEKRGALGFAQVSLILDNSKGFFDVSENEVTLTRRYYRNGESEYYMNRESCRLKDITELLMDTGLGKDGYSVIGQGKIAEIVSVKSTDRREIFEEAAGIARFRSRKEDAERKLKHTEENLTRINDKIDELELQVGPLEKQAETAKKFLLLRDEQRTLEISVWMRTLDNLAAQAERVNGDYENARTALAAAQAELSEIYARTESVKEKMRECDIRADSLRETLRGHEVSKNEGENTVAVLRANLAHNNENIERMLSEINEQAGRSGDIKKQLEEHDRRIGEIDEETAGIKLSIREKERKSEESARQADELQRGLAELVASENARNDALTQVATRLEMLEDKGKTLCARRSGIDEELASGEAKRRETAERLSAAQSEYLKAEQRADELQNVISGHRMLMSGREEKVRELSEELTSLTVESRNTESRIKLLSEMEREYEGLGKAVRTVMREVSRGSLHGVFGPVASLVVTQDRFTVAIETALGGAMQNIVVENQDAGKTAIEMLKRTGDGRATFLPVSTIKPSSMRYDVSGEEGFLGVASDLVNYDKKFDNIFLNLLGRTAVVETLSDAVRISKKYRNELRIVSLDGQLMNPGGSMTGGSAAKNVGLLSRANELKSLRIRYKELVVEHGACSARLAEARRELEAAKYELQVATAELDGAMGELHKRQSEVSQLELLISSADESLEGRNGDKASLSSRISENDLEMEKANAEALRLRSELSEIKREIESQSAGQQSYIKEREETARTLSDLRASLASLQAEREATLRSAQSLSKLLEDIAGDDAERRQNIAALKERSRDIEAETALYNEKIMLIQEKISDTSRGISEVNTLRLELEGKRTAGDKNAQLKNNDLLDKQQILARYEQKKLSAEMEEKQILDKLWDSYELSRSAAAALRQEVESVSEATKRISELRREIGRLGNVNVGAIEEYERVSERYNFFREQRDDVAKAKRDLEKIIGDITSEMKEIFVREFHAVDECFRKVFLDLFGGGKASLELEDEQDVLQCGIEIHVQPPGKAVTSISLLSGGEKSFVAIALYFAIMKVRPTPFCIMDEIEAALDESNVVRFAEYMRGMTKNTQFIVITHRRGTMEEADILYGVTMQEKGISTVISVDLAEAERTLG